MFVHLYDIWMSTKKLFVIESDVANNTKPIGNDTKFVGIAEMSIDIHLLYCLIGSGMSWHIWDYFP